MQSGYSCRMPGRSTVLQQEADFARTPSMSSEASNRAASQQLYVPQEPGTEAEQRLAALVSPFQTVTRFTSNRLKGTARKMANRIDVWRPCSADFGGDCAGGLLSGGVRKGSDIPFSQRRKAYPAHSASNMRMGEFWDPYAGLHSGHEAQKPRTPLPFSMALGLGQVWKGPPGMSHHDPPDPSMDPAHKTLKWIDDSEGIDVEQRRGVAALLDGCSRLCAPLFKRFCASDGDGKSRGGKLSKQKFELCLRSMDITSTNFVMQVLISSIAQPDGQVDYLKFMNDLESRGVAKKKPTLRSQTPGGRYTPYATVNPRNKSEASDDAHMQGWTTTKELRSRTPNNAKPLMTDPFKHFKDIRLHAELDPKLGPKGTCYFKPRHLVSGFGQAPGSAFCLPGGQMHDLSETKPRAQQRHPIERDVLQREMEFYRNHVLVQDVMAAREARHGGGSGGGSES